jgi:hypothetical protein
MTRLSNRMGLLNDICNRRTVKAMRRYASGGGYSAWRQYQWHLAAQQARLIRLAANTSIEDWASHYVEADSPKPQPLNPTAKLHWELETFGDRPEFAY